MTANLITREGYESLNSSLFEMTTKKRLEVAKEIEIARGFGDLSENAEYQYAKEKQALLEKKVAEISDYLMNCEIIENSVNTTGAVCFGNRVKIINLDTDQIQTFKLVGERESDIKNERISYKSPLGRELLGKRVGDDIEFITPSGEKFFEILEVFSY